MIRRSVLSLLGLVAVALCLIPLPTGMPAVASQGFVDYGPADVAMPPRTDAGDWNGTWFYENRDLMLAMWMRTHGGKPELKLQYLSRASSEAFETDWSGKARYYIAGQPAIFEIALKRREPNQIDGTWSWDVEFADSGRIEEGSFTMFRAGNGRQLVMKFGKLERVIKRRESASRSDVTTTWAFTKVSKRQALWDEIPF